MELDFQNLKPIKKEMTTNKNSENQTAQFENHSIRREQMGSFAKMVDQSIDADTEGYGSIHMIKL